MKLFLLALHHLRGLSDASYAASTVPAVPLEVVVAQAVLLMQLVRQRQDLQVVLRHLHALLLLVLARSLMVVAMAVCVMRSCSFLQCKDKTLESDC